MEYLDLSKAFDTIDQCRNHYTVTLRFLNPDRRMSQHWTGCYPRVIVNYYFLLCILMISLSCILSLTSVIIRCTYSYFYLLYSLIICFEPIAYLIHQYLRFSRCVHSPLQLRCGKLQWTYFRLCADFCIAVLQGSEFEMQCVALSCGR